VTSSHVVDNMDSVSILSHFIILRHACIHGVYACVCLYAHALVPQMLWPEDSGNISRTLQLKNRITQDNLEVFLEFEELNTS